MYKVTKKQGRNGYQIQDEKGIYVHISTIILEFPNKEHADDLAYALNLGKKEKKWQQEQLGNNPETLPLVDPRIPKSINETPPPGTTFKVTENVLDADQKKENLPAPRAILYPEYTYKITALKNNLFTAALIESKTISPNLLPWHIPANFQWDHNTFKIIQQPSNPPAKLPNPIQIGTILKSVYDTTGQLNLSRIHNDQYYAVAKILFKNETTTYFTLAALLEGGHKGVILTNPTQIIQDVFLYQDHNSVLQPDGILDPDEIEQLKELT